MCIRDRSKITQIHNAVQLSTKLHFHPNMHIVPVISCVLKYLLTYILTFQVLILTHDDVIRDRYGFTALGGLALW